MKELSCENCKYSYYQKGFPECFNGCAIAFCQLENIANSHKEVAFKLNAFSNCKYYKRKWWKFWI